MDVHKHSTQIERLEVVETGRRRRWSDDEKLRIVSGELGDAACDIIDGEAPWHFALIADDVAARLPRRAHGPRRTADQLRAGDGCYRRDDGGGTQAPTTGRMVIEIGKDRRVIVDAGVDAAALARVLAILERR